MNIYVDKSYRTRDGRKATVKFLHPKMDKFVGYIHAQSGVHAWYKNGKCHDETGPTLCDDDLVEEWKETRVYTLVLYRNKSLRMFAELLTDFNECKSTDKATGLWKIIAKKEITITEGEGL